jgi:hypothetical protein
MLIRLDEAGFNSRPETLRRAQTFTLERLVTIHSTSCDLRWALAELAVRSIAAMLELGRKRLAFWCRRLAQRARLASHSPLLTPWWQQGAGSIRTIN